MEKFVNRIIETDRKAREIIEQAQQEKQAVLADAKKRADAEIARRAEAAAFFQHAADGACRAVVPGQSGAQQYHQRHRGRALRPFAGADQRLLEILTVSRQPDAAAIPFPAPGRGSN